MAVVAVVVVECSVVRMWEVVDVVVKVTAWQCEAKYNGCTLSVRVYIEPKHVLRPSRHHEGTKTTGGTALHGPFPRHCPTKGDGVRQEGTVKQGGRVRQVAR
ncbi:hypothetical protein E2C01_065824 [Portunus trituberculatus]|uniref:Uncharacterized protein n=1 Tax=Portunus trituberculatus TaxID=210409 RepID=A0A5B7HNM0_PORTR|nr:hypothetical protein [Portunus trituberculatus]